MNFTLVVLQAIFLAYWLLHTFGLNILYFISLPTAYTHSIIYFLGIILQSVRLYITSFGLDFCLCCIWIGLTEGPFYLL